ncbi:MAG TPA: UPF0236 family protein [Candidatus Methylomirabilis sp.]|nr:UPF0236 family protein [Candidatus Methylomirabilis sp.]
MNRLRELEQEALAQGREWTRRRLERQLQEDSDALPAVCPQTGEGLKDVRWRELQLITLSGVLKLRVRHGYSLALGQWVCPARQAWGLKAYQRLSPELESRLVYTASETTSYEAAAQMAARWGCPVSDGCIHQHLQRLGEAAEQIELPHPVIAPQEPEFSLVIMLDGWLARERGPDWGAGPRKKEPQRILWHEVKSAVIYRLERRAANDSGRGMLVEKFVVATPPETSPVDFGAAVQAEARRRGMGRAKYVYLVMDGAIWLWELAEDRFAQAIKTLDFHHARDHLWAVANRLHGEDTPQARAWVQPLLRSLRKGRENQVVRQLEELLQQPSERTPESQELIEREVKFFVKHRDHLHYQAMEKTGAPRGSGAVESLGKQLQQRLRGCGQIWSRPGFTRLLKVVVLVKNQDEHLLWN